MKQFIIRLDDISWDMNIENFYRMKDLLIHYGIKPLIGVIPNNKDPKLKSYIGKRKMSQDDFWDEIRLLQNQYGWSIALHGYDHVYVTDNGGLFNRNHYAEFAGLPYEQQYEKIRKGKKILEDNDLRIDAFMAPGHSLDWTTVEALKANNIFTITDGTSIYPYQKHGVWFIPQVWPWSQIGAIGIETACMHINSWSDTNFDSFEEEFAEGNNRCISFSEITTDIERYNSAFYKGINDISRIGISTKKKAHDIGSKIFRILQNKCEEQRTSKE